MRFRTTLLSWTFVLKPFKKTLKKTSIGVFYLETNKTFQKKFQKQHSHADANSDFAQIDDAKKKDILKSMIASHLF